LFNVPNPNLFERVRQGGHTVCRTCWGFRLFFAFVQSPPIAKFATGALDHDVSPPLIETCLFRTFSLSLPFFSQVIFSTTCLSLAQTFSVYLPHYKLSFSL
jgi:hypothetical protein